MALCQGRMLCYGPAMVYLSGCEGAGSGFLLIPDSKGGRRGVRERGRKRQARLRLAMGSLGKVWARGEHGKDKTFAWRLGAAGEDAPCLCCVLEGLDSITSVFQSILTLRPLVWRHILSGCLRVYGGGTELDDLLDPSDNVSAWSSALFSWSRSACRVSGTTFQSRRACAEPVGWMYGVLCTSPNPAFWSSCEELSRLLGTAVQSSTRPGHH